MRIMSYNLQSGYRLDRTHDIDGQAAILAALRPDVCALNEVRMGTKDVDGCFMADYIAGKIGMNSFFGKALDINGGMYGNAILSRYPILTARCVDVPDTPIEECERDGREHRCAVECILDTPNGKLRAITCHFGLNHREAEHACETVLSLIKDGMPTVLMGDFNIQPDDVLVAKLRERLSDTGTELPLTQPSDTPEIKIDYIFTSKGIQAAPMKTFDTTASDHLPVYTDIEF